MKILLINLPRYRNLSVTREGRCELMLSHRVDTPATLLIIASILIENNHQIEFIDANGLNLDYISIRGILEKKTFECAIFTFNSRIIDDELKICDLLKDINPNCKTIGFSWYARRFGKEILNEYKNLDVLITEDPFSVIEDLINALSNKDDLININGIAYKNINNQIKINPKLDSSKDFDELPIPAYDLLTTFKPYFIYSPFMKPYALIYAGKGCPFGCHYCNMARTKYSGRSAEKIIKELKLLKKVGNVKYVWFFDEIFTLNRKRVMKVCKEIIKEKLKVKWLCDARVDLVDKNLIKLMRKAGCIGISYGVESGSQTILNNMNKGIKVEQAENALKWTRKAHIPIQLNIILGYIGENKKTLKETELFIRKTLPLFLQTVNISALDGTKFMDLAHKHGWVIDNLDWKVNVTQIRKKLKNYEPFEMNLWNISQNFHKMLYYNPKWWLISFLTLIWNPVLILPILGTLIKRSQSINLI